MVVLSVYLLKPAMIYFIYEQWVLIYLICSVYHGPHISNFVVLSVCACVLFIPSVSLSQWSVSHFLCSVCLSFLVFCLSHVPSVLTV